MTNRLVAFIGPLRSGKTTLLNLLGGLDSPTSGHIFIDGQDLAGLAVLEDGDVAVSFAHRGLIHQQHSAPAGD